MPTAADERSQASAQHPRLMWITPDRLVYAGLLGAPALRTMGCVAVYIAPAGALRVRIDGGAWQSGPMAVAPPYVPHQVFAEGRYVQALNIEAETVDATALPAPLAGCGVADDAAFVQRVQQALQALGSGGVDPVRADFDALFFGAALPARRVDPRIRSAVDAIKADPAAPNPAGHRAAAAGLSGSRFLHLFRQDVGAPLRSFRSWKRARSLLHHVAGDARLTDVAQDTGYPDSAHFSHSIRQAYGLKPKDIFAGSRRLVIYSDAPPAD